MAWLIQRTSPHEPITFWGKAQRWLARRRPEKPGDLARPLVPEGAMRFHDYDAAFDIAQMLRAAGGEHGEVIGIVPAPESA